MRGRGARSDTRNVRYRLRRSRRWARRVWRREGADVEALGQLQAQDAHPGRPAAGDHEDLAEWLDSEQRRLNYELEGGLPKSRLLKAILEDARPRLEAIVEGLRRK